MKRWEIESSSQFILYLTFQPSRQLTPLLFFKLTIERVITSWDSREPKEQRSLLQARQVSELFTEETHVDE